MSIKNVIGDIADKIVVYFDMDGVLAKWKKAATQEELNSPGYFLNLEECISAVDFLRYLRSLGIDARVLSAVIGDVQAKEKKQWNEARDITCQQIYVPYGESKAEIVEKTDEGKILVLIDDFGKNLQEWKDFSERNVAIKFYNGINSAPRIEFDESSPILIQDTWAGASIDYRMDVKDMLAVLLGQVLVRLDEVLPEEDEGRFNVEFIDE